MVVDASSQGPKSGTILGGKYHLVSLLGRGGMGSVWRAVHLSLQAPVAVKLIDPSIAQVPEALARFHREAQAAATLRSPNVVQVIDHGVDDATRAPFIVMELMEGESLADRLERQGRLSPAATVDLVMQMARALTRAHQAGIVHRDLKPDNVFLVRNEDEEVAKILDFGIAKSDVHRVGAATATGTVMGTAYYMSPEQISGSKEVDHRTDLWAVGVITHECITGAKPFDSETLGGMVLKICTEPIRTPSVFGGVPAGFDQWFERSVMRDPAKRFQSAREMADELKRVCETGQVVGTPVSANELANSKTQWLETGRVGLTSQSDVRTMSVPIRADTGGPLSRTASGASPSVVVPTRSVWPWVLGTAALLGLAGGAIAFATLSPEADAQTQAEGSAAAAATAPALSAAVESPSTVSSAGGSSIAPSVKIADPAQVDAGAPLSSVSAPIVAVASNDAPLTKPPPRSGGGQRGDRRPAPPPETPSPPREDAPSKKPKSPFDGLLKSRK